LEAFVRLIHPFLQGQRLDYSVLVVEQADPKPFNRGKIFNAGVAEARRRSLIGREDCLILHDVDLIPEETTNMYACHIAGPRHMSSAVDVFNYNLPYEGLFGGAVAIKEEDFAVTNGFPNAFWGWGGEDDELRRRLSRAGHRQIVRYPADASRYRMLHHDPGGDGKRAQEARRRLNVDQFEWTYGLADVQYEVAKWEEKALFTKLSVML